MFFKRNARAIEYFLLIFLYRGMLDYAYHDVISVMYKSDGFLNERGPVTIILSWVLVAVSSVFMKKAYDNEKKRISFVIMYLLYLMSFIPFTCVFCFGILNVTFVVSNIIYWFVLIWLVLYLDIFQDKKYVPAEKYRFLDDEQIKCILLILGALVVYISGRYTHFRLNFSLTNVYDLRADAANFHLPVVFTYAFAWSKNIITIIIAFFVRRKKYLWAFLGFAIQVLSFGIDGSKMTIVFAVLTVVVNFLPKLEFDALNRWAERGFIALVVVCTLIYKITGNLWPIAIFVRRVLFLPVKITNSYIDFFSTHTPDFFRQSILRHFGAVSPYPSIAQMIGEKYIPHAASSNNGLLADAYANLGVIGILVFPVLLTVIFKLFDFCSEGLDSRIFLILAVYISNVLINSFLFTVLLTHGLLIALLVLGIMKSTVQSGEAEPNESPGEIAKCGYRGLENG